MHVHWYLNGLFLASLTIYSICLGTRAEQLFAKRRLTEATKELQAML